MAPSALFSSPFENGSRSGRLRPLSLDPLGKRKRDENTDENDFGDNTSNDGARNDPLVSPFHSYTATGTPALETDLLKQYETARQAHESHLPQHSFPHAALRSLRDAARLYNSSQLEKELANLKPPLQSSRSSRGAGSLGHQYTGLKQRHLAVLTAIVHKSLLQDDYVRAGRAWGMLLHAEVGGRPMNIRSNGLWGLGAEILLRKGAQTVSLHVDRHLTDFGSEDTNSSQAAARKLRAPLYDQEAFENAKRYYQRLILQYPFRRWDPEPISSLHFYPAMYSIWISSVQEHSQQELDSLGQERHASNSDDGRGSSHSDSSDDHLRKDGIRKRALERAEEIAASLEELLLSSPYSDDATLWKLRGNVALWVGDLCVEHTAAPAKDEVDIGKEAGEVSLTEGEDDESDSVQRTRKHRERDDYERSLVDRETQRERAFQAFETVRRIVGQRDETDHQHLDDQKSPEP